MRGLLLMSLNPMLVVGCGVSRLSCCNAASRSIRAAELREEAAVYRSIDRDLRLHDLCAESCVRGMADLVIAVIMGELLAAVCSWPWATMLLQVAAAVWVFVALGVLCTRAFTVHNRFGESAFSEKMYRANAVTVSEVSCQQQRGATKRMQATTGSTSGCLQSPSPATMYTVRSVDILPVSAMEMRVRVVQLSSSTAKQTTPAMKDSTGIIDTQASRVQEPMNESQTRQCSERVSCEDRSVPLTPPPKLRSRWRLSASMVLFLSAITICAHSAAVNAEAVTGYIVLVSIPIINKVLPLKNLAEELIHRGYRVGFALPENYRHLVSDVDRLEFIALSPAKSRSTTHPLEENALQIANVYENYATTLRYYASFQASMYASLVEEFEDDRPHLVIVDRYTFGGFDACHAFGIPYVVNSPSLLRDIDAPPAYIPAPFSNFTMRTPSVLDRCFNSVHRLRFRLATVQVFKEINRVRGDHRLPPVDFKEDLIGHHLVLVNSVFGLDEARPITPQFQMVGMLERAPERLQTRALPPEFATWVASEHHGSKPLVFLSLTSDVPVSPELLTVLLDGLEHVNARIVCRIQLQEDAAVDLRTRARSSVFFLGATPVDDSSVLQLAPVSVMMSAGDYYGVQQALELGIPVLGIPLTAEQMETMSAVARTGTGLQLHRASLSQEQVHNAVVMLLQKPQFAAAAFHVGEIIKTGGGTKRAADHIESVLSLGVMHVVPIKNLQALYKTYLVDVYLIYGVILFCSVVILRTGFAVISSILQLAPDVHLGMSLDDELGEEGGETDAQHAELHKHGHGQHKHSHGGHHAHHHAHHHQSQGKVKDV